MATVNIASHLKQMARRVPDQLAVLYPSSRDASGTTVYTQLTYQQLDQESDLLAAGLSALGIGRNVRTVLMVPPSIEFFALTFALFKAGAIPVLVDPGMGIRNLGKCLTEAEPQAFIGITKAHVARVLFGWGKRSIRSLVTVGRRLGWRGETLDQVREKGRKRQSDPDQLSERWVAAETQADDTAAILFTSGSTGVPKGAVYSHGNFAAQVDELKTTFGIETGEVDLCTFPLFALFAPALGMTAVVPRMDFTKPARVNPKEIDEPIRRFQVNNLFGSPALLNRVGRDAEAGFNQTSQSGSMNPVERWTSMRRVLSAGAPVSPMILERFLRRLPEGTQIFTPYGATESLPVAVIGSREILEETRYLTAQGAGTCVGRPVASACVKIIRITDDPISEWNPDLCLNQGEIGEIVVDSPMVTQQYYHRPDLTALAKIRDPATGRMRHRMGDVGYFDEIGRLWFCGRKSHRVVVADKTLFTDPVEGIFNMHPAVFRTALVGVKRAGQTEPVLCVERESNSLSSPQSRLTDQQLRKELLELGAKFEQTRSIQTILFHRAFPVDIRHNSKIFREKLAVWAAKRLGAK